MQESLQQSDLINNIPLNDEETKGKIIGKEGRNIKAL